MKKLTMGLMLSLISISSFAHFNFLGYCGDKSYYHFGSDHGNAIYEVRAEGSDNLLATFTTSNNGQQDSLVIFNNVPAGTVIQMRVKYASEDGFYSWVNQYRTDDTQYSGCSVLAIAITNVFAELKDNNLEVSFRSLDESQVMKYQIVGSTDGKEYNTLLKAIDPTGAGNYSTTIPMPYAAAGLGIGALLFLAVGVRNRKLFALMSVIAITFIFVSCSKEKKIEPETDLTKITSIRVVAVQTTGAQVFSEVKPIRKP